MKLKVCGLKYRENMEEVMALSPDYVGFIFYPKSPRHVETMPNITGNTSCKRVGVFVNATLEDIQKRIDELKKEM